MREDRGPGRRLRCADLQARLQERDVARRARSIILEESGSHFDRRVVRAFEVRERDLVAVRQAYPDVPPAA